MVHNIDAIYDHGVFRPIEPLALPEGSRVRLRIEGEAGTQSPIVQQGDNRPNTEQDQSENAELPTLLERMSDFAGTVDNLPADASVNLDHYLYGTPKRQ